MCTLMGCRSLIDVKPMSPPLSRPHFHGLLSLEAPEAPVTVNHPSSTELFLHYWNVLIPLHKVTVSMLDA